MSIERIGKFLIWKDAPLCPSLGIETSQIDKCVNQIRAKKYEGVFGCPAFGFHQEDLNFLSKIPHIRYIHFWEVKLKNIDAIYDLNNLQYFSVGPKRPAVNFSKFPKLQKIIWEYKEQDVGIKNLNELRNLDLWRYKQPSYETLSLPDTLEYLEINWSDPPNLSKLQTLKNLKELQLHYCRKLESLDGLKTAAPNLEKLVVTSCKNCMDIEEVKKMPNLNHVFINKKKLI